MYLSLHPNPLPEGEGIFTMSEWNGTYLSADSMKFQCVARMERSGIREYSPLLTVFPAFRWRFMRATCYALCCIGTVFIEKNFAFCVPGREK